MKKWFMLDVPVWDTRLLISVCQTDAEFKRVMDKFYGQGSDRIYKMEDKAGKLVLDQYDDPIALRLLYNPSKDVEGKASLGHELSHAVQFMLDYRGLKRSHDSEEAYAYTTSFLTREIYKRL